MTNTIAALADQLNRGETSSQALIDQTFERINDPDGQGALVFVKTMEVAARRAAADADNLRAAGLAVSPLAGLPVSVKDLFDTAGEVTCAGSTVLNGNPPANCDATVVARLRSAGAVIVGRTNMTEFAYSGLGLNPHYGTPLNPYERDARRIPGGSSSGAAISVTDGMCIAGFGSDTGGSVRIPAALCGLVGFKPTQHRIPMRGTYPLSPTLDTVGPLAPSVACCAALDAVIAAEPGDEFQAPSPQALRIGVLRDLVFDNVSDYVGACVERALSRLSDIGAQVRDVPDTRFLCELPEINAKGGFAAAEAFHILHKLIEGAEAEFDPRVAKRVIRGGLQSADDYLQLQDDRCRLMQAFDAATWPFDVVVCPTVPCIAPLLSNLQDDEAYFATNALVLRNPSIANFVDRPAITIPCHRQGEAPVGLMLIAERDADRRLLNIAAAVETIVSPSLTAS